MYGLKHNNRENRMGGMDLIFLQWITYCQSLPSDRNKTVIFVSSLMWLFIIEEKPFVSF